MSWEAVDKALNETLTATIACHKAAQEAQEFANQAEELANQANEEAKTARYWADKFQKKRLLFGRENEN